MELTITLDEVQALVRSAFPGNAGTESLMVEALEPGYARIRLPFKKWMLRPGNVLSGPTLMTAVDTAMYVAVLGHIGVQLMAVTADMNLRFISKGLVGDVIADARILKLGRKLIVMESRVVSSAAPEVLVMHATGSYARPG
ncbi:MAG: PaaI family thioesterase [Pseudomonadota bacterium]